MGVFILVGADYFEHMVRISEHLGRISNFRYIADISGSDNVGIELRRGGSLEKLKNLSTT